MMIVMMVTIIIITTNIADFCVLRVITIFQDCLACLVNKLLAGRPRNLISIPGVVKVCISTLLLLVPIQPLIKWQ